MNQFNRLLALIFALFASVASAQQMVGGEISYKCQSENTYVVTVALYARCPSPNLQPTIKLYYLAPSENSSEKTPTAIMNQVGSDETIAACLGQTSKCSGGTGEVADMVVKRTYSTVITLPRERQDWTLSVLEGRASLNGFVNTGSQNMYLEAIINNLDAKCNTSPSFETTPLLYSSINQSTTFQPNLTDVDGDRLKYALVKPANAKGGDLAYIAGLKETQPISGAFTFDANTGKMVYTASKQGEMSSTVMKVTETRGTKTIGSVMREMYFQTLAEQTSPPTFSTPDTLKYCAEGDITVRIQGVGQQGAPVQIIWNNKSAWPNSTVSNSNGLFSITTTPPNSSSTLDLYLDLTLVDNNCGKVNKVFVIKVNPKPNVLLNNFPQTVSCIDSVKGLDLKLTNSTTSADHIYLWKNESTGETIATTSSIKIFTASIYSVLVTNKKTTCKNSKIAQIKSDINFTFDKYCTDLTTVFYDVSGNPDKLNPSKEHWPLRETKKWKWTFYDSKIKTVTDTNRIGRHKFTTVGDHKVILEVSDGTSATCVNRIEKQVYICGKPPVRFVAVDSCVNTERSDLKLRDFAFDATCKITDFRNVRYYVDGVFRTFADPISHVTNMGIPDSGRHEIKLVVQNDAGCKDSSTRSIFVRDKPKVTTSASNSFFYRCDKGFPDTSFTFTAKTELTDSLLIHKNQTLSVSRTDYDDTTVFTTTRGRITVPFKIKQNKQSTINFSVRDGYGCTNDTAVVIKDPITPDMRLSKYYCYLNDTLKLVDMTYANPKGYEWGLKSAKWDMKDGKIDTTLGFVNHAYSLKSLDEAVIQLIVEDVTGCKDTTTTLDGTKDKIVYLSEPDTSQFQIKEPKACFSDTVRIFGIKDKFINTWYFRFKDNPSAIYDTANKFVYNPDFGKSFPSNLDTYQFYESNKYDATIGIFYNEPDTTKNFEKVFAGSTVNKSPKVPTKVCHIEVTKPWKIVERLHYNISDAYNHCYDSLKVLNAVLPAGATPTAVLDTASFKWSLFSPKNALLDEKMQVKGTGLAYTPSISLFTDTATATVRRGTDDHLYYPPYILKVKYSYLSEGITCVDTASLKVANERVKGAINPAPAIFCLNYNKALSLKDLRFLSVDEQDSTKWDFGNNTVPFEQDRTTFPGYKIPDKYLVTAYAKNMFGCPLTTQFEFEVKPSPIAKLEIKPVCFGLESILDADSSKPVPGSKLTDYYWYIGGQIFKQYNSSEFSTQVPGDTTEPNIALAYATSDTNIISRLFTSSQKIGLVVRDENGCYAETKIVDAIVNPLPVTSFTAKTVENNDEDFLGNEPIKFDATTEKVTQWTWDFKDGTGVKQSPVGVSEFDLNYTFPYYAPPYPIEKNIYDVTLKVKTEGGCIDSVKKRIDVNVYFVLPNAFSPNEDGLHDQLLGVGKGIKEMKEFKIFNRWGEVVHTVTGKPEKDDSQRGYLLWDGKYKGEPQPVGAYVYYAVVKTGYGDELIFKGNLALLK